MPLSTYLLYLAAVALLVLSPGPTMLMCMTNSLQHGPRKARLLTASRKSYLWYEQVGDWMRRYTPLAFVHAFMTRTGRISHEKVRQLDPGLAAAYEKLHPEVLTQ